MSESAGEGERSQADEPVGGPERDGAEEAGGEVAQVSRGSASLRDDWPILLTMAVVLGFASRAETWGNWSLVGAFGAMGALVGHTVWRVWRVWRNERG